MAVELSETTNKQSNFANGHMVLRIKEKGEILPPKDINLFYKAVGRERLSALTSIFFQEKRKKRRRSEGALSDLLSVLALA